MNIALETKDINQTEVLRYLGHNGQALGAELYDILQQCAADCARLAQGRAVHAVFDLTMQRQPPLLRLQGASLTLRGQDIAAHLAGAGAALLMAATLGSAVEQQINRLKQRDMTRAIILDATCSAAIESICDKAQAVWLAEQSPRFAYHRPRYSPGYGDLSLDIQQELIRVLQADKRIGLTCASGNILIPRKSVTAVIGLFASPPEGRPATGCQHCRMNGQCMIQQGGKGCGHPKIDGGTHSSL